MLFDEPVDTLSSRFEPSSQDLPVVDFTGDAEVIYKAVKEVVAAAKNCPSSRTPRARLADQHKKD